MKIHFKKIEHLEPEANNNEVVSKIYFHIEADGCSYRDCMVEVKHLSDKKFDIEDSLIVNQIEGYNGKINLLRFKNDVKQLCKMLVRHGDVTPYKNLIFDKTVVY